VSDCVPTGSTSPSIAAGRVRDRNLSGDCSVSGIVSPVLSGFIASGRASGFDYISMCVFLFPSLSLFFDPEASPVPPLEHRTRGRDL
jgi:hypothetical protein